MTELLTHYADMLRIVAVVFGVLAGAIVGRVLASLTRRGKVRAGLTIGGAGIGGLILWLAFAHFGLGLGGQGNGDGGKLAKEPGHTEPSTSSNQAPTGQEANVVRIHMLGGTAVKDNRIYLLDGQTYTWETLEPKLTAAQTTNPSFHTVEISFGDDSVDPQNPAVVRLKDWATEHGLGCRTYVPPDKQSPKSKVQGSSR
jgi:hypothetical protein